MRQAWGRQRTVLWGDVVKSGFTLLEILVATAVVAVLIALALPALRGASAAGLRATCMTHLHTLGQAIEMYRGANDGVLPLARFPIDVTAGALDPLPALMPHLDAALPSLRPDGTVATGPPFLCPADDEWGPATGCSYIYAPYDLFRDSAANPERDVTLFLERDPTVVIMFDRGPWHPGEQRDVPLTGRNVLRLDGGVESGSASVSISPRQYR